MLTVQEIKVYLKGKVEAEQFLEWIETREEEEKAKVTKRRTAEKQRYKRKIEKDRRENEKRLITSPCICGSTDISSGPWVKHVVHDFFPIVCNKCSRRVSDACRFDAVARWNKR